MAGFAGILELARHPGAIAQPGQDLFGPRDGALHPLGAFGQHELGSQRPQHVATLLGHGIGHGEDAAIPPGRGNVGQADAGVPAGRLHDDHAGTQPALFHCIVDHRGANPVLHRIVGIVALVFHRDASGQSGRHPVQPDEWRVAERLGDILIDLPVWHEALACCATWIRSCPGKNNTRPSTAPRASGARDPAQALPARPGRRAPHSPRSLRRARGQREERPTPSRAPLMAPAIAAMVSVSPPTAIAVQIVSQ